MASTSYSESQEMYDIFLSFRGPDTRTQFTDRLYHDLIREGYRVFRDKEGIEKGENNKSELCKAIENSSISIIVFSKTYTESTACLFEVQRIIKHRKAKRDHVIVPVYYRVEPSEIKKQAEGLAKATGEEVDFEGKKVKVEEVKEWSAALMEVARMGGSVLGDNRYENEFIKEIISVIESKQIGDYQYLDENMKNLKRKIVYLEGQENDTKSQISNAECRRLCKRPKKEVEVWLANIQGFKDDVQRLDEEVVGARNGCTFSLRARLGKCINAKVQEAAELQEKGKAFDGLLVDDFPTDALLMPPTKDFLESTKARNVERVWECLMDDGVRKIGIYGMGGIGKTTIMKLIHNRLLKGTDKFDTVYWVTVSKSFNIIKLQSDIAKELGFGLSDNEDETRRAKQLFASLSHRKKYVLIIDDLWEYFPLHTVGIPEPTRPNGCKLVLTTRSFDVCRRMGCTPVKVNLLIEEEAQTLFLTKAVGHDLAPDVQKIAYQICKECGCLPLAIVTVAGSLRGLKDMRDWRNALNGLIHSTRDTCDVSKVFEQLKFSYDRLGDKVLKDCFLYCALYPEDHEIKVNEVIEYWIAEGLIGEMESQEAEFDEGHAILRELTSSCLLESCIDDVGDQCVRMHDLIRDMALRITRSSPRFMVKAGERLESIPYEVWSENLDKVSLMDSRIIELPNISPVCPRLTTLLLNWSGIEMIPYSFFTNMPNLKVLDLSETPITSLPKSISNLEHLHTILLDCCRKLKDVPSLEKLKALKVFKLTKSRIEKLPEGIEKLVNLRKLDLSCNNSLQMLPSCRTLRNLLKLQYLDFSYTKVAVFAEDLLCLTQLEVVAVRFHELPELIRYMTSPQFLQLKKYCLLFGTYIWPLEVHSLDDWSDKQSYCRNVCIGSNGVPSETRVDQLRLPSSMTSLELYKLHVPNSLSAIPCLKDVVDLRTCDVNSCDHLESVFSVSTFPENGRISLGNLEELYLGNLQRFRVLFDGIASRHGIYSKLKRLTICNCGVVKNIIPVPLLKNIPNLESLYVSYCQNVENIIVEIEEISDSGNHQDNSSTLTLLKLKVLRLYNLPSLKSIYNGVMIMCPSIKKVIVTRCQKITRLPLSLHKDGDQATAPPALKIIKASKRWWDSLEWDDPHTKAILQPYFNEEPRWIHYEAMEETSLEGKPPDTLKQLLIACAKALSEKEMEDFEKLIEEARGAVSVSGVPIQRVGAYMIEGLVARKELSGSSIYRSLKFREQLPEGKDHILYEICPYLKFGYMAANWAIVEACYNEDCIHIIDYQIRQGTQWMSLLQVLAASSRAPPRVRITGIDDPASGSGLEAVGRRLENISQQFNIPVEFHPLLVFAPEVTREMLSVRPGEAVVVNFPLCLHHTPDESVDVTNPRDRLLRMVKSLSPKLVTLVEQESNTNTAPFLPRFVEALDYYWAMFESIDVALPWGKEERISAEMHCFAGDIVNVVACEGVERVERHELLGKWKSRFMMAGFRQFPLSTYAYSAIGGWLKNDFGHYNTLVEKDGAMLLGWKGMNLVSVSAWC